MARWSKQCPLYVVGISIFLLVAYFFTVVFHDLDDAPTVRRPEQWTQAAVPAVRREGEPGKRFYLAVVGILRNEGLSVEEWVEHHLSEGVDFMYVLDAGSTDDTLQRLAPFTLPSFKACGFPSCCCECAADSVAFALPVYCTGPRVAVTSIPGADLTTDEARGAYDALVRQAEEEAQWIMVLDGDDFLTGRGMPARQGLAEVLNSTALRHGVDSDLPIGQVAVPSVPFGLAELQLPKQHPRCLVPALRLRRVYDADPPRWASRFWKSLTPEARTRLGWNGTGRVRPLVEQVRSIAHSGAVVWQPDFENYKSHYGVGVLYHEHPLQPAKKYPRDFRRDDWRGVEADGQARRSSWKILTILEEVDLVENYYLVVQRFAARSEPWLDSIVACDTTLKTNLNSGRRYSLTADFLEGERERVTEDDGAFRRRLELPPSAFAVSNCGAGWEDGDAFAEVGTCGGAGGTKA